VKSEQNRIAPSGSPVVTPVVASSQESTVRPGLAPSASADAATNQDAERSQIRLAVTARARVVKRNNAVTASLTGAALAILAISLYGFASPHWTFLLMFAGALAGLFYANAFEYVLHRFVLHWPSGFLAQRHALHHDSAGSPDEARYVNFATSPWVVVLVFVLNAPPALAAGYFLGAGIACGMLAGFTAYFIAYEEIHWRIHFGGWLPGWMRFARRHHLLHHRGLEGRHNVFLPVCDWIFERRQWRCQTRISLP
jgi:Fatty acid hydroxylase superfamily